MPSDSGSKGQRADQSVVAYHKSRLSSPPVLYLQMQSGWEGYGLDGTLLERGQGSLSFHTLSASQEIDESRADALVSPSLRAAGLAARDESDSRGGESRGQMIGIQFRLAYWRLAVPTMSILLVYCLLWGATHRSDGPRGWIGLQPDGTILPQPPYYGWLALPLVLLVLGLPLLLAIALITVDNLSVYLTTSGVSGPSARLRWWGRLGPSWTTIAMTELDRERSAHRSCIDRLSGRQYLYSVDDKRIYVARWALSKGKARLLLDTLGIRE